MVVVVVGGVELSPASKEELVRISAPSRNLKSKIFEMGSSSITKFFN
jgi:hypothetical protein